ncbi:MAG: 5-bromo-4-chloroindolyl phosphate hydrolysis family protein [Clostridia bacterium]|nr:5-bromo-4-chloroindolyl phosphate hydrolysis family protein [Clostridia bacterium]
MKPEKKKRIVHIKSALPLFGTAALIVLLALIFPLYRLWALLLSAALAVGCYFALERVFPGRDEVIIEELYTGNKELDEQIKYSRGVLERFRAAAATAGDERVSSLITRIADSAEGIIDEVIQDPNDRGDAYTFFSYYMPTMDQLLGYYTQFALSGKGENARESKKRIEGCLEMVAGSFEKFQDKLYRNEAVEVKASVDVLKLMLRTDGLAQKPDAASTIASATAGAVDDALKAIDSISAQLQNEAALEQNKTQTAAQ